MESNYYRYTELAAGLPTLQDMDPEPLFGLPTHTHRRTDISFRYCNSQLQKDVYSSTRATWFQLKMCSFQE